MRRGTYPGSGFTILEVLVAIVLLGVTLAAVGHALLTGDRIRGRARRVSHATIIAGNEAERVRKQARYREPVADTAYTETSGGLTFEVRREIITDETTGFLPAEFDTREIAVRVIDTKDDAVVAEFRLLQGYY